MELIQNLDASILAVSNLSLRSTLFFCLINGPCLHQSIGKKPYSVKRNSMPEERTVSVFTRMNTAQQNAQEVRTLIDMTQIRQHVMYNYKVSFDG